MFKKECTFGDFLKSVEKIATNILASRLKTLEQHGIIQKLDHPESKAKVLYRLTEKGIHLIPILVEINLWADKYSLPIDDRAKLVLQHVKVDKEKFIQDVMQRLKS